MKNIRKIIALVVLGMLVTTNFYIVLHMIVNDTKEESYNVFVEDGFGNTNGEFVLEKREDGKYDLEISTWDPQAQLEILGLLNPPEDLLVKIDSTEDDILAEYVVYIGPVDMEKAIVTLPSSGEVSGIYQGMEFDLSSFKFYRWKETGICFSEGEDYVTFEVEFSGAFGIAEVDTFTVTTTKDEVRGSFRRAILDANENPGLDRIAFNIPSAEDGHYYYKDDGIKGQVTLENIRTTTTHVDSWIEDIDNDYPYSWWSIRPKFALPAVTDPVIIDGYTQQGASENSLIKGNDAVLRIELDGIMTTDSPGALHISAGSSTIRGLVIQGCLLCGIHIDTNGGNVIEGNYIGTDVSGTYARGNFIGLNVFNSSGNRIGGEEPSQANVISGNYLLGTLISGELAKDNIVTGNYINCDSTGTKNLGNGVTGVRIGDNVQTGNVVEGNFIFNELSTEIIFFDTQVPDYMRLFEGILAGQFSTTYGYYPNIDVVVLDVDSNGIEQITKELEDYTEVTGIHIVAHGSIATLNLGNTVLNSENMHEYVQQISSWKEALTEEADILLYGCNIAKGDSGLAFIEELGELIGADIAASDDFTGSEELGGNWNLEVKTGDIETESPFSDSILRSYDYLLGTKTYYDYPLANYTTNPKISTHIIQSFVNGLRKLANVLGNISSTSDLSDEFIIYIPGLLDLSLSKPGVPMANSTIPLADVKEDFRVYVAEDINNNFTIDSYLSELESFLDGIDYSVGTKNISVDNVKGDIKHISGTEYELLIDMIFSVTGSHVYQLDLGRNADVLGLSYDPNNTCEVELKTGFSVDLTFGTVLDLVEVDLGGNASIKDINVTTTNSDFFVRDTSLSGVAQIDEDDLDFGSGSGHLLIGFLEIKVENGDFTLYANATAEFEDPNNASGDNRITLAELLGTSTSGLMKDPVTTSGSFRANFPVIVKTIGISGFDSAFTGLTLNFGFPSSDPFDEAYVPDGSDDPRTAPPINLSSDFRMYLSPFNNILPDGFVGLLGQLKGWLGSFGVSQLFSAVGIPFAEGKTLADVMGFYSGMDALITNEHITVTNEDGVTIPMFISVQTLTTALINALSMSLVSINPCYDRDKQELTFTIKLNPPLPKIAKIPLDFSVDLGPLGDITTNIEVELQPTVSMNLVIGIDLSTESEIGIPSALTNFALRALIDPDTGNSYTPTNGTLTENAKFTLTLGSLGSVNVNVTVANMSDNTNIEDLAEDIENATNSELVKEGIDALVDVEVITGDRLAIFTTNATFIKIQNNSADDNESAGGFEMLGFWSGQIGSTSPIPQNGVITSTASFNMTIGAVTEWINITQETSNANDKGPEGKEEMINNLISDIRTEINDAFQDDYPGVTDIVEIRQTGDNYLMAIGLGTGEKFIRVYGPNEIAIEELGLRDERVAAEITTLSDRSLNITAPNHLSSGIVADGQLDNDANLTIEVDGDPVSFSVHAANGKVIGFVCNQAATGTLTAGYAPDDGAHGCYGFDPGVDITIKLSIGDESYIISLWDSHTQNNSDIEDLIADFNNSFKYAIGAENGSTFDISSLISAGKNPTGEKLTLTPTNISETVRVSSMGTTQDNEDILDLVDDLNEALGREKLSDGTRLDRVVVAGLINESGQYYLVLSVPSAPKDWLNITHVSGQLGFEEADMEVIGPRSNGQLSNDADFTLVLEEEGGSPITRDITIPSANTTDNEGIIDLVKDINNELFADTALSGKVIAGLSGNRISLSATDKDAKLLRINDPCFYAQDELGFSHGITAYARERRGHLFIRDAYLGGGVDLVVNTTVFPAIEARFGFVGITIGNINGTLPDPPSPAPPYTPNTAIHGGVSVSLGGIESKEITNVELDFNDRIDMIFDNKEFFIVIPADDYSINSLRTKMQQQINLKIGAGNVTVTKVGSKLVLSTPGDERLKIVKVVPEVKSKLGFYVGQQTGSFYLSDLVEAVSDFDILEVVVDIDISGEGNLTLSNISLQLDGVVTGLLQQLGIDPRIVITLPDFTNISTLNVSGFDLGAIGDGFDDMNFSSIITALKNLVGLLQNFSFFNFLDEPLPILGVNLYEALEYIEEFLEFLEELEENPASIVQDLDQMLKEALGLPSDSDAVSLSIDNSSSNILRLNLSYNLSYSASLPITIDLIDLLGITMPSGLEDLINLSGAAGLEAEFEMKIALGVGIDLDNFTNIYIYDNTGLFLEGFAEAENVNFVASLGPLGLFITGGHAVFNEDGDPNNTNPAYFKLTAFLDPDSSHEGDKILLTDFDIVAALSAGVGAILPCYFPTASNFIGNLDFDLSIAMAVSTSDPFDIDVDANLNSAPDFTALPDLSDFSLIESLLLVVEGLDMLLAFLEVILGDALSEVDIPLIGDGISDAAEFIEDVRGSVIPKLRDFIETAPQKAIELVQQAIFNALGPNGLKILVLDPEWHDDGGGNSQPDYRDVQYTFPASQDELQFNIHLGGDYSYTTPEIDIGIPGLGIEIDGGLTVSLQWNLLVCFGLSMDDGFYFDTTPWDEFTDHLNGNPKPPQSGGDNVTNMVEIEFSVILPEKITGKLLFLQLDIENMDVTMEDPDNKSLIAYFHVNVEGGGSDERLSFTEIPSMDLDFSYGVEADLDLSLTLGVVGGDAFPSIKSEFYLRWGLGDSINNGSDNPLWNHYAIPWIRFEDVRLNLGAYFSDFLGPILEKIQTITKPIQPLIDVLTEPIPVLSDLSGDDITLLDIAGMFGVVDPSMIEAIADLITLINSLPTDGGDIEIIFGTFEIGGDGTLDLREEGVLDVIRNAPSSSNLSKLLKDNFGVGDFGDLTEILDKFDFDSILGDALGKSKASPATKSFAQTTTKEGGGWSFPIFEDPGQIFGLLLGRPADIIVYDMPKLTFDFTYSQFFPIWDGLGAEITGSVGCIIDLSFGYDTYGIQKFAEGGFKHPLDLLKGFYVGDLDLNTGADIPEVTVYGSLTGAVVLNIVVAKAGVGGGVYVTIDFNLNDPDGDGKVRIEEILGNIQNGFKQLGIPLGLICIFDVSGKVEARLFAFVELLWGLWEKTWYFGPSAPLLEFEYTCPRDPILASENNGELKLHMGKYAKDRLYGDISDGDERFYVDWKSGDTVYVWAPSHGVEINDAQEYSGVTKIVADAGEGNDLIDLYRVDTTSITAELKGGSGNDVLIAGDGIATFYGGLGDDVLIGGLSDDYLYGEKGNDNIIGSGGDDILEGSDGNDIMNGDAQPEDSGKPIKLRGSHGKDIMTGGKGDDWLAGGGEDDTIRGEDGKDSIWGDSSIVFKSDYKPKLIGGGKPDLKLEETGEDHIAGDADADTVDGEGEADFISGGGGPDVIKGGGGNDRIWGDSSFKSNSTCVILLDSLGHPYIKFPLYGTAAGDRIKGGGGADLIYGEDGNDYLFGESGNDEIYGNRSSDVIYGGDNDDELYGGTGNDRMFGNDGNDDVYGEGDNDVMFGDDGEVQLVSGPLTLNYDLIQTVNKTIVGNDDMDGDIGDDIILGGPGQDTITGDEGYDSIIGDNGEFDMIYLSDINASLIDMIQSKDLEVGDVDTLYGGEDDDIIIGGRAGDTIFGDSDSPDVAGKDILIGDNGYIDLVPNSTTRCSNATLIKTTDTSLTTGGDDDINGSEKADVIMGGVGNDELIGGKENDIILGDSGEMNYNTGDGDLTTVDEIKTTDKTLPAPGGVDVISGGEADDIVLGGGAGDTIYGDDTIEGNPSNDPGEDILIGDQGELIFVNGLISKIQSTDTLASDGGVDTIKGNEENDIIIGGVAGDNLRGETGDDIIIGDEGKLRYNIPSASGGDDDPETLDFIETITPSLGGADDIEGNEHDDIIFGGADGDDIEGNSEDDIILGDNGEIELLNDVIQLIKTNNPSIGGSDTIEGNEDEDIILGGAYGDDIWGNSEDDIILGDNGKLTMPDGIIEKIETTDPSVGGSDTIEGNDDEDKILGGAYGDDIWGHAEDDIILGDNGMITQPGGIVEQIETTDPAIGGVDTIEGNEGADTILGGPYGDYIWGHVGEDVILGDNGYVDLVLDSDPDTIDLVMTTDPAIGGNDTIEGNENDDIILGGAESDDIWGNESNDVILGDNGMITMPGEIIDLIETTDPAIGGNDTIEGNDGDDTILGGAYHDVIWGHMCEDIILGDNGMIIQPDEVVWVIKTTDPTIGGSDTIEGNECDDIILGGTAGDDIWGHDGEDIILGDNGALNYVVDGDADDLDLIITTDPAIGGNDTIEGNNDTDMILGGAADDDIWGHASDDYLIGDNGNITQPGGIIEQIKTTDSAIGGSDTIYGNDGDDIIMGGMDGDYIEGNAQRDIILGDNGLFDYVWLAVDGATPDPSTLDLITSTDPNDGGDDTIYCGSENDIAFGGTASDIMYGNEGNDLLFGDHAKIERLVGETINLSTLPIPTFIFTAIYTSATDGGDDDLIHGNEGDDILLGQQGDDEMYGDEDDDDMIGGHNVVGGIDELDSSVDINDRMDGGSGDDVMTGDNAIVNRRPDTISPRIRALNGKTLYDEDGNPDVDPTHQPNPTGAKGRDITLLDHSDNPIPDTFGDDIMAGGPNEDVMFGELGDDVMQGDASVSEFVNSTDPSVEGTGDGDDYMEGNGGKDLIFGNLGQDDIIGGSSDLFGLTSSSQRPDDSDTIFGGAGTRLARNDPGDESDDGHAIDSDYILGDNGDIFRIVGTNGKDSGDFLSFTYDNYGNLTIIPRNIQLLDYTPGGSATDIGNDDLIHGEAGDDLIHGMTGNDVLFGEGQDDDIYGGTGHDRIYGGTGEDGVLGDDGRIYTSRNGESETLYGLNKKNQEKLIKIPGPFVGAWVYIEGRLKKDADVDAFEYGGNDTIYGGLGDDWLHGGAGNDGMSGAEALPEFYNSNPITNTSPLPYDPVTRKFAAYDAENPRTKIAGFFLNFEATDGNGTKINDGKDRIFGDQGHDWLVGGTMNDRLFGGLGDDLMNGDDNHDSQGGLNNMPDDPEFADCDWLFGGGGLDVLIINTGGDRAIDWIGEFNSYIVPYSPFGFPEAIREISPHLVKFLLALGEACGADQSLVESDGELGLVDQKDPLWGDQMGGPRDPQAGNLPGVHRDTFGGIEDDRE